MTGRTHKRISLMFAYAGCLLIYIFKPFGIKFDHLYDFYIIMAVCAEFCKEGTLFPDLDHAWVNLKEKTVLTKFINVLIHLTGGTHRSRHTHSVDICLLSTAGYLVTVIVLLREQSTFLLWLVAGIGFFGGWITHLIADMLTLDGVYLLCGSKKRTALVPKKLFGLKFNTGGAWEDFVFRVATVMEWLFCLAAAVYPVVMYVIENFYTI